MIFCFDVLPVEGFGPQIEFEQIFFRVIISPKIVGVFPQHVGATSMARLGSSKLWVHKWTARLWIVFNVDVVERYGKVVRWILIQCEFQKKIKLLDKERPMIDTFWWMKCWTVSHVWDGAELMFRPMTISRLGRNPGDARFKTFATLYFSWIIGSGLCWNWNKNKWLGLPGEINRLFRENVVHLN